MKDATEIVVSILSEALEVPVTTEAPAQRPDRLVCVALSGDYSTEYLMRPRFQIMCWGRSDVDAHCMCLACVEALWDAALEHPTLSACDLETMGRDEWSKDGHARYVAEVDLTINV